jgi:hypothetical protein
MERSAIRRIKCHPRIRTLTIFSTELEGRSALHRWDRPIGAWHEWVARIAPAFLLRPGRLGKIVFGDQQITLLRDPW